MRFAFPHTAVYWPPAGANSFGRPTQGTPIEWPCRWQDTSTDTIDPEGSNVTSKAQVYLAVDVAVGGLLYKGRLQDVQGSSFPADPKDFKGVYEIISRQSSPDIKSRQTLTKAFLI